MILAAGLGTRMQGLTEKLPKPLLKVGERTLIEHTLANLVAAGITEIVINHFYLGDRIEELLGSGERYGATICYSREPIRLETAGGIIKALPALKDDCFIVVNSDIWTNFPFASLTPVDGENHLAHLVMVENTAHKPTGDFRLSADGRVHEDHESGDPRLTFSGISVLHRKLFKDYPIQPRALAPLLRDAMQEGKVRGQEFKGLWMDIGTPERLREVNDIVHKETT
jgi:N-acetyl-alpha-D-muramate 1-phosphate uridylyltransferase